MRIDGCRAKLRRARGHRDDVERRISEFLDSNPYRVSVEREKVGVYLLRCENPPPLPVEDWATIVGDCVHNARSALDYLAWELAGGNVGMSLRLLKFSGGSVDGYAI